MIPASSPVFARPKFFTQFSGDIGAVTLSHCTEMRTAEIEENNKSIWRYVLDNVVSFFRRFFFRVLSIGPIPNHVAFIMDGNRRYAKQKKFVEGVGHKVGFLALLSMLNYCYDLGVRYVTIYAFSIDNFKRNPDEVQSLMNLMLEKIEFLMEEEGIINQYGIRVNFLGNLKLLSEPVKLAAERAMAASINNKNVVLSICVAYTSTDEIVNAVYQSCKEKWDRIKELNTSGACNGLIRSGDDKNDEMEIPLKLRDVERHLYAAIIPDPDIVIRTSGETRLSNFLLWQTAHSYLYSPSVLWPEIGFWDLFWGILNFQRNHHYLIKKRKQL